SHADGGAEVVHGHRFDEVLEDRDAQGAVHVVRVAVAGQEDDVNGLRLEDALGGLEPRAAGHLHVEDCQVARVGRGGCARRCAIALSGSSSAMRMRSAAAIGRPPVEEYPGSADARYAPGVSDVGPDQRAGRSWSASEATMAGKPAWRTRRAWASASASVAKRPTRTRASSLPWT